MLRGASIIPYPVPNYVRIQQILSTGIPGIPSVMASAPTVTTGSANAAPATATVRLTSQEHAPI